MPSYGMRAGLSSVAAAFVISLGCASVRPPERSQTYQYDEQRGITEAFSADLNHFVTSDPARSYWDRRWFARSRLSAAWRGTECCESLSPVRWTVKSVTQSFTYLDARTVFIDFDGRTLGPLAVEHSSLSLEDRIEETLEFTISPEQLGQIAKATSLRLRTGAIEAIYRPSAIEELARFAELLRVGGAPRPTPTGGACCRRCDPRRTVPCGDRCIEIGRTCNEPRGCACPAE